jgi:peroxiredoxin
MIIALLMAAATALAADEHATLAIGASAPDFSLPGIDGRTHSLTDYASSRILAVLFTCNHCPTAQMYEDRIKKLADDYQGRAWLWSPSTPITHRPCCSMSYATPI